MKKLNDRFLKGNQIFQMALKDLINQYQEDLNNSVSTTTVIEASTCAIKKEPKTEMIISVGMI